MYVCMYVCEKDLTQQTQQTNTTNKHNKQTQPNHNKHNQTTTNTTINQQVQTHNGRRFTFPLCTIPEALHIFSVSVHT